MNTIHRRRPGRAFLLAALMMAPAAAAATAQTGICDEEAGTLGIQGMRCEGCTFRMSETGLEEARFRTEPEITALARGFAGGDRLRAGDRIVAIDGALVTTRDGSDRLVGLRASRPVTLRVRRDGRLMDLRVVPGSSCDLQRAAEGEIEVERVKASEVAIFRAPPPPRPAPSSPAAPAPVARPAAPRPPAGAPSAYLGFGLRCSDCGMRGGAFQFTSPPVIDGVAADGPAQRAGARSGDAIVDVDGLDITTPAGARRLAEIEAGDTVRLTVLRDDARRDIRLIAGPPLPPSAAPAPPAAKLPPAPGAPPDGSVRYRGRIGPTAVVVRGAPVRVERNEETGELIIHTADTTITLQPGG